MSTAPTSPDDLSAVFVTRFSLSSTSAIGVQTRHLIGACARPLHLFWEQRDFQRFPHALRLNSILMARFSPVRRRPALARALGLTPWSPEGRLSTAATRRVQRWAADARCAYLAPIDSSDTARMRALVAAIDKPFVLHLWDLLDLVPADDPHLVWLISHAHTVFGLSPALCEALGRSDAKLLLFARDPGAAAASPPAPGGPFRVAVIGDVTPYLDGLSRLLDAQDRSAGAVRVCYIGSTGVLRRLPTGMRERLEALGFCASDADRDRALATCHAGFIPGPSEPPATDARSRFSIPSRILDYMAVGLPIVGTVHPASATSWLARRSGLGDDLYGRSADDLQASIDRLRDPAAWRLASQRSTDGDRALRADSSVDILRAALDAAASAGRPRVFAD